MFIIDPDVPSFLNSRDRSFKHWLIVNIPGNDTSKGKTLDKYIRPSPKNNTGKLINSYEKFIVIKTNQ